MKKKVFSVFLALMLIGASTPIINSPIFTINAEADSYQKLTKPTKIKTKTSDDKITLSWAKVEGADAYSIYRYDNAKKKYVKIKTTTKNNFTIVAKSNVTYKFRIYSMDKVNGKYIKGNYAYKKVIVENDIKIEDVMKNMKLGMTTAEVKSKFDIKPYIDTYDTIAYKINNEVQFLYRFREDRLSGYGIAYKYTDEKYKYLAKYFSGDEWEALAESPKEFTKDELKNGFFLYLSDEYMALLAYDEERDMVVAAMIK